ncbi:MAG: protein kinase, partial [Gemmatimonadota bacterium]
RDKLKREKELAIDEAIRITTEVAKALDYAHRNDVLHRDIKPSNILLFEGQALVSDFGIALAMSRSGGRRITETGMSLGTPEYMSPEQATAERELDGRSDLYSLGCVLYEMLAGEPPYTGHTAQAIIAKALVDPVPSVSRLRDAVPEGIDSALKRALAKVPADRFASAAAFVEVLSQPAVTVPSKPSVAVLPLLSLSTDPEDEFFADGITEDVIAQLSKIGSLKVISRTSVMRFKNSQEGLKEIGAKLGVATLLEGSVRRAGNRVRVVAQLIEARTDDHLWAETYDRELADIFEIQSDVAVQIAAALEAELTADQQSRIEKEPTRDLDAYQLFLKGRHCLARVTSEGLLQSVEYMQQAVDRDPTFALAYSGMAGGYIVLGMGYGAGVVTPDEAYSKAKAAAAKAIEIDSELGEAHAALAMPMFVHDFEWANAESALERALELNPNAADTFDIYGVMLAAQGRFDEAIAAQRRGQELDPLTPVRTSDLAASLLRAGRYDEALLEAKRVLQLEPHFPLGHATLGWAYFKKEMYDDGLAELERALTLSPKDTVLLGQLGQARAMAGRNEEARDTLRQLEELSRERYVPPYHMAYVYTGLGEYETALDALEQSYEQRAGGIYGIKGSFLFARLRSHPRFKALLRKMNLEQNS